VEDGGCGLEYGWGVEVSKRRTEVKRSFQKWFSRLRLARLGDGALPLAELIWIDSRGTGAERGDGGCSAGFYESIGNGESGGGGPAIKRLRRQNRRSNARDGAMDGAMGGTKLFRLDG
jgi:hypothetical protein